MELEQFVQATLEQIIRGVTAAQQGENGDLVNARAALKEAGGALIDGQHYGMFTRVDFDVAVSGQTTAKGGAIELQGNHKGKVRKALEELGFAPETIQISANAKYVGPSKR